MGISVSTLYSREYHVVLIAINQYLVNKASSVTLKQHNGDFENFDLPATEVAKLISEGLAFCAQHHSGWRDYYGRVDAILECKRHVHSARRVEADTISTDVSVVVSGTEKVYAIKANIYHSDAMIARVSDVDVACCIDSNTIRVR